MADYSKEIRDTYEESGALNVPAVSFADRRKNEGFDFVILPQPQNVPKFAGKGYRFVPEMEPLTIKDPAGGTKPIRNPKYGQPRRWDSDGKIMQKAMLLISVPSGPNGLANAADFMSENQIKAIQAATKAADPQDLQFIEFLKALGLRRLYISGGSLRPEFDTAVKSVAKAPQVGGWGRVEIAELEPNDHGGRTKIYAVTYNVPNAETLALVDRYRNEAEGWLTEFLPDPAAEDHSTPDDSAAAGPSGALGTPRQEPVRGPSAPAAAAATDDAEPPF